jgi:hypothetical protein
MKPVVISGHAIRTCCVIVFFASSLAAHHSLSNYDNSSLVPVSGTITKLDWTNPHAFVYLSVKGTDGKVTTQRVQIAAPGRLTQLGVDKNLFAIGATVTFEAWAPKNGSLDMPLAGRTAVLPDGKRIDVSDKFGMP